MVGGVMGIKWNKQYSLKKSCNQENVFYPKNTYWNFKQLQTTHTHHLLHEAKPFILVQYLGNKQ